MKVRKRTVCCAETRFFLALPVVLYILCAGTPTYAADTLPADNAKYRAVRAVYDNIARAFGDSRMPPRLLVKPKESRGGMQVAFYHPGSEGRLGVEQQQTESYISLDEKVYDLLTSGLGSDAENGLAVLLAHELTHYYNRHGWVNEFGNAFAATKMGAEMVKTANYEEVIKYETEADYFGGFYGYVAGYNTLGLAPNVIDLIYTQYRLPDKMSNYPSRSERKAIAGKSEESLRKMVPLFEAANRLLLLKRYGQAARLYDHIARTFPSREIYNNAGVSRALEALALFKPGDVRFAYPFEFDSQTRLQGLGAAQKRGYGGNPEEVRQALLQRAAEDFDNAIKRDRNYAPAYVNRAAVHDLQGEHEMAALLATKALDIARKQDEPVTAANALALRGIAYARMNQNDKALADIELSRKGAPVLAAVNAAAIQGADKAMGFSVEAGKGREILSLKSEAIGGVSAENLNAMEPPDVGLSLKGVEKGEPELRIFSRDTKQWSGIVVDSISSTIFAVTTPAGYAGQSGRGIKIGNPFAVVREKYGEPSSMVPARQGNHYVYEKAGVIFKVLPDNTVGGWILYSVQEEEAPTPAQKPRGYGDKPPCDGGNC